MKNKAEKNNSSIKTNKKNKKTSYYQPPKEKHTTEFLSGFHSVHEALKAGRRNFYRIIVSEQRADTQILQITTLAQKYKIAPERISSKDIDQMTDNDRHQGFVALSSPFPVYTANELIQNIDKIRKSELILVLENIEDPHNLGALIRTAVCAGVNFILVPGNRAAKPSPTVSSVSAGAMEHAQIGIMTNTASCLKLLKDKGFWVFGLDAGAQQDLFKSDLKGSVALVIGGENKGIRPLVKKECDFLVSLPNLGPINSLNASVAGGIAMYEALRQRHGK